MICNTSSKPSLDLPNKGLVGKKKYLVDAFVLNKQYLFFSSSNLVAPSTCWGTKLNSTL